MLVLSRNVGESIVVGGNITVTIVEVNNNQIRVGIDAPKSIPILRKELIEQSRVYATS